MLYSLDFYKISTLKTLRIFCNISEHFTATANDPELDTIIVCVPNQLYIQLITILSLINSFQSENHDATFPSTIESNIELERVQPLPPLVGGGR